MTKTTPTTTEIMPPALRPVFYQSLTKDAGAAYNVNAKGCVTLPKQKFTACFNDAGAQFSGAGSLAFHLVGYGRGGALSPVNAVQPVIKANQVSYAHGNLAEWWRVLPIGFEQGFTLTRRPAGHGELVFALAANHKASRQAAGAPDGTLAWGKLRYGGLVVTDAKGKVVPATLTYKGARILIAVNDVHAVYPVTVDPLVWLEQKVTASDGAAGDNFGTSVALAGATAVVGAPNATVNGNSDQGTAYVFSEAGGSWSQTAKLTASDGAASNFFGTSVALAGSTALVGAPYATVNGNAYVGAAYVFSESDGTWSQTGELSASNGSFFDYFGSSVALAGTTALVGAYGATVGSNPDQGAAYVFSEAGGSWSQTAELSAGDGAFFDEFGNSVAFAGSTALVGVAYATVNGNSNQGAAYVFSESDGTWSQTQKLTASDGAAGDVFGGSVAVSGSTAVVGAYGATVGGNESQGAAYVFSESGGTWSQTQKLTASDGAVSNNFGWSVAASGSTALVGAYNAAVSGNPTQGAAYFYGQSDLGLNVSAPQTVGQGQNYVSQTIATNNASAASPAVSATVTVPAAASFVSASATQGSCSEASGVVTCDFGAINGNAGTATANVTLKATGSPGTTINNTASVALAEPTLTASAPTQIGQAGCPDGYTTYSGTLGPNATLRSPSYEAPAGMENAILLAPPGFKLYVAFQNAQGRKIYPIPGNEVHRHGPAGAYSWGVKANGSGGAYTFCLQRP